MHTHRKLVTLFVVISVLGMGFAYAQSRTPILQAASGTYYVDSASGSDGNPGTEAQPWKTVGKVNGTSFGPGDSVLFKRGGTYDTLRVQGQTGTASNPIVYGAYGDGAHPSFPGTSISRAQHVVIQDLAFENGSGTGVSISDPDAEYITIDRCIIQNNRDFGIAIWTPGQGNDTIRNSIIRNNGAADEWTSGIFAKATNLTVANNEVVNNGYGDSQWGFSHGIYVDDASNGAVIYGNRVYNNVRGHGIQVKSTAEVYRNTVYNNGIGGIYFGENGSNSIVGDVYGNVLYGNMFGVVQYSKGGGNFSLHIVNNSFYQNRQQTGWTAEIRIEDNLTELEILNNAVYAEPGYNVYEIVNQSNAAIDYNVVYATGQDTIVEYAGQERMWSSWQAMGFDTSGLNQDPGFRAPASGDLHLADNSVCINRGTSVPYTQDIDGQARPQQGSWDIGADEVGSGDPVPTNTPTPEPTQNPTSTPAPSVTPTPGPTGTPNPTTEPTPSPQPTSEPSVIASFDAEDGTITEPFLIRDGYITQPVWTEEDPNAGGHAIYKFNVATAGNFIVRATVDAATTDGNSFFVNVDSMPQSDTMVWDISTLTDGFEQRTISWRGSGTTTANEFSPQTFGLGTGDHELIIVGREAGVRLSALQIIQVSSRPPATDFIFLPMIAQR